MKKILVTTDTSSLSQTALQHARALAKALEAKLLLLNVQTDPNLAVGGEFGYSAVTLSPEEIRNEDNAIREQLHKLAGEADIRVEHAAGRTVPQTILAVAKQEGANMIVMTTHGRSGLGRVILGSVAEAVVHDSPVPVLLIKGDHPIVEWKS